MVVDDRANLRNYASLSARAYHNHRSSDADDRRHGDNLLAESLKLENVIVDELAALHARIAEFQTARPIDEYDEDRGAVLWWRFPIVEPPYCGQPSDDRWTEDYYTHWSPLPDCRLLRPSEGESDA